MPYNFGRLTQVRDYIGNLAIAALSLPSDSPVLESGGEGVPESYLTDRYPFIILESPDIIESVDGPSPNDLTFHWDLALWLIRQTDPGEDIPAVTRDQFIVPLMDAIYNVSGGRKLGGLVPIVYITGVNWGGGNDWPVQREIGERETAGYLRLRIEVTTNQFEP